ncbi:MAG: AI-2E family transporter [Aristaeellaceae bacterium]
MTAEKKTIRTVMLLILFAVCVNAAVNHLNVVGGALRQGIGLITPILLGFMIAFLLSIPVRLLEQHVIKPRGKRWRKGQQRLQRPVSILLSTVLLTAIIGFIIYAVIPSLVDSLHTLVIQIPALLEDIKAFARPYRDYAPELIDSLESLTIDWAAIERGLTAFLKDDSREVAGSVISAAFSVFGVMFSMMFALIIAFSAVSQKERLARQCKALLYAALPQKRADWLLGMGRKISGIFASFITGQVLESFILGSLVFVCMMIFRFPNAFAVSALVMLMAFVPIIGAWVSAIVGAIMILASDGMGKALGFVLMIIILQQIEGNLIYPRVMGKRVGLPSLWVLVAITLGSGLMGVAGMLLFVPLFAVIYQLLRDWVQARRARRAAEAPSPQAS